MLASPFDDFPFRLDMIRGGLPPDLPVYLVGGAVRDRLLGRATHDLDFVLPSNGIETARRVANALHAAFYPLDPERDTGRVVLLAPDGSRQVLDFSTFRGQDLESDLRARDFTINAMAIDIRVPQELIDPLGGAGDLRQRQLRSCSPASFREDPLRILRGVRLSAVFRFRILPETLQLMREAVAGLPRISPERLRDELFRLLDAPKPAVSVRVLDRLDTLPFVLPELAALKGVTQTAPHVHDVWDHTLSVLQKLESLLDVLSQHDPDRSASLVVGATSLRLGRYRGQIKDHLNEEFTPERTLRPLLFLAALYHDAGKPETRRVEAGGRVRFLQHELVGAELVESRGRALRLSTQEVARLHTIVRNHLRPILLSQGGDQPSRRAVFRFFRDTGPAGVDVCLLSMADVLGTYETTLPQDLWGRQVDVVRALLEAWWERPGESISPPALVTGTDLITQLGLKPGPQVGELLEAIREAQASGQVSSREQALELARSLLTTANGE